jgi:CBS domain-containing protein
MKTTSSLTALLTPDVAWIGADTPLAAAVERLAVKDAPRCLLVGEPGAPPHGILTMVDVLRATLGTALSPGRLSMPNLVAPSDLARGDLFFEMAHAAARTRVAQVMSSPVRTIAEDATIGQAIDAMLSERVESLPVVRGRAVIGMLHRKALVGALARAMRHEKGADR